MLRRRVTLNNFITYRSFRPLFGLYFLFILLGRLFIILGSFFLWWNLFLFRNIRSILFFIFELHLRRSFIHFFVICSVIRFAITFVYIESYRTWALTWLIIIILFIRLINLTWLLFFKSLSILVLLWIYCIWILLIFFSFLTTQNMRISNLIFKVFIPRNLLMERRSIIHAITCWFILVCLSFIRWKVMLIIVF